MVGAGGVLLETFNLGISTFGTDILGAFGSLISGGLISGSLGDLISGILKAFGFCVDFGGVDFGGGGRDGGVLGGSAIGGFLTSCGLVTDAVDSVGGGCGALGFTTGGALGKTSDSASES